MAGGGFPMPLRDHFHTTSARYNWQALHAGWPMVITNYLKKGICVSIIDPVTTRSANLYGELLDELDTPHTPVSDADLYAVTCRGRRNGTKWRLEAWQFELKIGEKLPTLPICLSPEIAVPL